MAYQTKKGDSKMKIFIVGILLFSFLQAGMNARGVVSSEDRAILSSEIAGNITYLLSGEGEYFKKGTLLAKINCDVYEAQRRQVDVQRNIAKLQMQKNQELEKFKSIGSFEVLISKEEYNKQKTEYDIVSLNVERCFIYAPFDGRVVEKKSSLYQSVKPQQELLEIIGTGNLEVRVVVPASWISKIRKNDVFVISIDETGTQVKAQVKELGAVIDPASQTILVRAKLIKPTENIIAGMSATAYFDTIAR